MEGTGDSLPALLGLRSMREKQAVLEMTPGKERLTFPGPGGYSITWSPGTQHIPLVCPPSGHLVIPCDDFDNLTTPSGLPAPTTTFHARGPGTGPSDEPRYERLHPCHFCNQPYRSRDLAGCARCGFRFCPHHRVDEADGVSSWCHACWNSPNNRRPIPAGSNAQQD